MEMPDGNGEEDEMAGQQHLVDMNLGKLWETVRCREAWNAAVHGITELDTTWWLNNGNIDGNILIHSLIQHLLYSYR